MIAVTGGMSVDADDQTPLSIREAGARVVSYGAATFPGAMFMLAYIGDVPILGLPACVMYHNASVFDLVVPRILAGDSITRADIVALGHGGLCSLCKECRYPRLQKGWRNMIKKTINLNGVSKMVLAESEASLSEVIREQFGLTGTKVGCGKGQCGACSVITNGKLVKSCMTKIKRVQDGAYVTTIEGFGTPNDLHPLQLAWVVHGGAQCGFCSPGFIVSAKALLAENLNPTRDQVRDWFHKNRNACRCTGYKPLVDAVMDAAKVLRGEMTKTELGFKLPEDGRIWGTNYPRPTAIAKVTGTIDYGADLIAKMPAGTLHLALAQANVSHAKCREGNYSQGR